MILDTLCDRDNLPSTAWCKPSPYTFRPLLFLYIISFVNITLALLGKTREPFYLLAVGTKQS